jgi:nucleosome assembly protein 1-like 1
MARARDQQTVRDSDGVEGSDEDSDIGSNFDDDELAHLPPYVIRRVEKLQKLHEARDEMMENYLKERALLEKKFEELMKPIYEERASVVKGDKDDEIAKDSTTADNEEVSEDVHNPTESSVKGIPQFWASAMARMDSISERITEEDVDCLEHLLDVKCIGREDGKGFTLEFHFSPNDYFSNIVLTKEYDVPNLLLSDEPVLKNVKGTEIDWKEGRCLTQRMVKKKQRGKGKNAGRVRTVEKAEEKESFFKWFSPPDMPAMEALDDEEAERLEEIFDGDYEIAEAFRSEIIPKALLYFTNQADDEEMQAVLEEAIQDLED